MKLFKEIEEERVRQDKKWGGPRHDAKNSREDWVRYITQFATGERGSTFRSRMIKCAALALAAAESRHRKLGQTVSREALLKEAVEYSVVCPMDEAEQIEKVVAFARHLQFLSVIAQCLFYVNRLDEMNSDEGDI